MGHPVLTPQFSTFDDGETTLTEVFVGVLGSTVVLLAVVLKEIELAGGCNSE